MTPSVREIDEETIAAYQADGVVVFVGFSPIGSSRCVPASRR